MGLRLEKLFSLDLGKCRACRVCEVACSFFKAGECNPARSRIRSERWENGVLLGKNLVHVCQQCTPPACKAVCPTGAISLDEKTGATLIDYSVCNGCGLCIRECPFGSIHRDPEKGIPLICDLCGGEPKCVEWCPAGAIRYVPVTSANLNSKRESSSTLLSLVKKTSKHGKE